MVTVDEVLDEVRRRGGRVTEQRTAVVRAVLEAPPHPSADDIASVAQRHDPSIHRSTVYRNLNTLAELGVLSHVHLDHGRSVYHLTEDREPHLVCNGCGAVSHLPTATFRELRTVVHDATGFRLGPGHFAWSGRCERCRPEG